MNEKELAILRDRCINELFLDVQFHLADRESFRIVLGQFRCEFQGEIFDLQRDEDEGFVSVECLPLAD